jgi:hypothetical protein
LIDGAWLGVWGGTSRSSNASEVGFTSDVDFERDILDKDREGMLEMGVGAKIGENGDEESGEAPIRPMMDGSRWCS